MTSTPAAGVHPVGLEGLFGAIQTAVLSVGIVGIAVLLVAAYLAERRGTGRPSFVSRAASRLAARTGRPVWEPLPLRVVLGGLLVALVGWRAGAADAPWAPFATLVIVTGLATAMVGGVMAGAIAHPPASVTHNASLGAAYPDVVHPPQAHRVVTRRGRLGAGPVGAAVVVAAGAVALVVVPLATLWRAVQGTALPTGSPAQSVALAATLVMVLGAWLLHAEGRRTAQRAGIGTAAPGGTVRQGRLDRAEVAVATATLLALSALVDAGLDVLVAGALGVAALVLVRVRGGAGSAADTALAYGVVRVLASIVGLAFGAGLAPLWWQALLAALVIEVLVPVASIRPSVTSTAG